MPKEKIPAETIEKRTKQLSVGYQSDAYKKYIEKVPKRERKQKMPITPDKSQHCSRRSFDQQVKFWRISVNKWVAENLEDIKSEDDSHLTTADSVHKAAEQIKEVYESPLYTLYTSLVPVDKRSMTDPQTPCKKQEPSSLLFEKMVHDWKNDLSKWYRKFCIDLLYLSKVIPPDTIESEEAVEKDDHPDPEIRKFNQKIAKVQSQDEYKFYCKMVPKELRNPTDPKTPQKVSKDVRLAEHIPGSPLLQLKEEELACPKNSITKHILDRRMMGWVNNLEHWEGRQIRNLLTAIQSLKSENLSKPEITIQKCISEDATESHDATVGSIPIVQDDIQDQDEENNFQNWLKHGSDDGDVSVDSAMEALDLNVGNSPIAPVSPIRKNLSGPSRTPNRPTLFRRAFGNLDSALNKTPEQIQEKHELSTPDYKVYRRIKVQLKQPDSPCTTNKPPVPTMKDCIQKWQNLQHSPEPGYREAILTRMVSDVVRTLQVE